ncbi:sigma-70 family RNA polymerase sigma factor [Paraburkholderia sp. HP33-1]|uniref:sigma-70 family RNA polymerase sigma factor n=1 Tax=Paraburkholderia sp. HP33-1 TaxID=2883243 RepID=UPI001F256304|nr:sigma-70 family RNA polymerase sigma factor [Paraburkholderia sp. HP33-1]
MSSTAGLHDVLPALLPRLRIFALHLARDKHDAEDLLQRTCLRALERAHQLQADTAPLSWMYSIMHNSWVSEIRARNVRSRARVDWDESFVDTVADPQGADPQSAVFGTQIMNAVQRLPDAQRAVLLLVAVEGLSYQEAADVLGVPIGTVMSRLARARIAISARFRLRNM